MDKKEKITIDFNLFTFDLIAPPGFENAKIFKDTFLNHNRKVKIKKILGPENFSE